MDGGREQPQDVKLVGDELGVREEVTSEAAVGVGHGERDPAHVLSTRDVLERGVQLRAALALDQLHQALVLVVYHHGDEATLLEPEIMLEKVLIDADLLRPRVQTCAALQLELLVQHPIQEARRATIRAANRFQIAEVLASPEQAPSVALRRAIAF